MRIRLCGAAGGEVTGSAYLVETERARILVDCGMFQGGHVAAVMNRTPSGLLDRGLDAVLVTHAHLDHTGRLPLLPTVGLQSPVFATPATLEMSALVIRDSARLQLQDSEKENRRLARAGESPIRPLYTPDDAEAVIRHFRPVPYQKPVTVAPGIQACWAEAGHILGSASLQLLVDEGGTARRIVFSGDIGPRGVPIIRDCEPFRQADLVFIESTYGDRDHRSFSDTAAEFTSIVTDASRQGGKMIVPTFAVGRAQVIMILLSWLFRGGKVKPFPVFLDSPMAIEAWQIYSRHVELFDDEMLRYTQERPLGEDLRTLRTTTTPEESKAINDCPGPCLIMAGAGMCNAGRILHHLRQNLWKSEAHVLIVGFQSADSLGRQLVDGAKSVTIFGEKIAVKATIHTLGGFSAHAGQTELLGWAGAVAPANPRMVITHGEDGPRQALADAIKKTYGLACAMPAMNEVIEV
jgi:metallo-beta-lactamase family protein